MLERREKQRAKTALPGSSAFARAAAETPCVVLNLSGRGACVAFAPDMEVPRMFELRIGRVDHSIFRDYLGREGRAATPLAV